MVCDGVVGDVDICLFGQNVDFDICEGIVDVGVNCIVFSVVVDFILDMVDDQYIIVCVVQQGVEVKFVIQCVIVGIVGDQVVFGIVCFGDVGGFGQFQIFDVWFQCKVD